VSLLYLASMLGAAFIVKESDILAKPRQWLMQRSSFFAKLFLCYWCVGFWAGIAIYLLHSPDWNVGEWIVWGCAGSASAGLGSAVIDKLTMIETKEN
jgi:hypothetical protein